MSDLKTRDEREFSCWMCSKCRGTFADEQRDNEDDDRCPLCKTPFSQMPYEPPHEIADLIRCDYSQS